MPKPRPQQAAAPEQQRPTRDDRASTKGASAPFVIPRGENAMEQAPNPTPNSTKPSATADAPTGKTSDSGPAVIPDYGRGHGPCLRRVTNGEV